MKRIIAMLLVCLTLVQMLPLSIRTYAQETENLPAGTVETTAATEETVPPTETALPPETTEGTEVPTTEATERETAETVAETTVPLETGPAETLPEENDNYQIILDEILNAPVEESEEKVTLPKQVYEITPSGITTKGVNDHKYYESESNNDWALADLVENDYTVIASIGGIDTDFFAMRLNYKSKVTILAVAQKSSFGMGFYNSSEKLLAKDITGTKTNDGNYSYTMSGTYSSGKYYYVTLDSKKSSSYNYIFYVEIEPLYLTCKHSNKKKVETVAPTCGSQGYTTYSCSACETIWKDKYVPATGNHTYYDQYDSICDVCKGNRYLGVARGACGEKMNWVLYDDGRMVVSGWGDMQLNNGNGMPWDSYKSIIKKLEVKDEVFCIRDHAFENCESLTSINLAGSVLNIENGAFSGCSSLTSVTLGQGVRRIGDDSFGGCTALRRINIPASVDEIHYRAFDDSNNLEFIYVDSGNTMYSSDSQGILYNKDKTKVLEIPWAIRGNITIPNTVKEFGDNFYGRDRVTGVVLPEGLASIPSFERCSSLISVTLPNQITLIPGYTFQDCTALKNVEISESVTMIGQGAFKNCPSLTDIALPGKLKVIEGYAFMGCNGLKSIVIPKTVTTIGIHAFEYCYGLKEITFMGSAPTIESYAFGSVTATVYYPITNTTWTSSKKQNYGGTLSWVGKCIDGHVEVIDTPGVAPTCLEPGLSPDSHCSNCGTVTSVQKVLPTLGHEVVTDAYCAPTCLETGITEGSHCGRCGEVLVAQSVIPALGHDRITDVYVSPLCEETGLTEGSHCDRCDLVFVAQNVIPALGHAYTNHWCNHCGRAEFVEVLSIEADKLALNAGEQANLTAVLDYPIRPETEILWSLAEGDEAYVTLESSRDTAVLTAKRQMEARTVTVFAKSADGLHPAVGIRITLQAMPADQILFAGKSLTLKPLNMATGKAYTAKQLTWFMDGKYEPFLKLSNGKVTAQKVPEKVRTEVVATVNATGEKLYYVIDVYPVATQVEVKQDGEIVNGKTIPMDYSDQPLTLTVDTYPLDTYETVIWSISDKKGQYADYTIEDDKLTISSPRGNSGTVTIKATVDAGVKKTVSVKVSFGSFAKEVKIAAPGGTTLRGGESLTLSAWVSRPAVVSKPGVVWSVSDKTAASVSGGKVTAKNVASPTTVTVTATSKDGMASNTIELKILPKEPESLVLMEGSRYVTNTTKAMNYGETWKVEAFRLKNGQVSPETVTWTSSKDSVAYVANGTITAIGVGTAKITATAADGRKAVMSIKVATLVSEMKLVTKDGKNMIRENGENVVLLSSGKSVNLTADIPTSGAAKTVTWELTEGSAYAKLSASGAVSANKDLTSVAYATVKATAKDGSGVSASIRVKILPLATGVQIFESGSRVRTNTTYVVDMLTTPRIKLNTRVYPDQANQAVELSSSSRKIADFNESGELVCFMPGTVTITAKALDGSNRKVSFKLTIIKRVTDLTLKAGLPVDGQGNLFVAGGKSLKLAPMILISPSDATNKKLTWSVSPNQYGITISSAGVLSTRKVPSPVTVNVMVMAQDGSGCMTSFDVTVYPA